MGQIISCILEKMKQLALSIRTWIKNIIDAVHGRILEIISLYKSLEYQPGKMTKKDVLKKEVNNEIDKLSDMICKTTGMSKEEFRQKMNQEIEQLPDDSNVESWIQFFQ